MSGRSYPIQICKLAKYLYRLYNGQLIMSLSIGLEALTCSHGAQMDGVFLISVMQTCFFGTGVGAVRPRSSPDDHEFCNHVRVCVPCHSWIGASFFLDRPDYN